VAKLVHCLVPLQLDEADHLVPRAPDPACQE
jgi:hypothetical protein